VEHPVGLLLDYLVGFAGQYPPILFLIFSANLVLCFSTVRYTKVYLLAADSIFDWRPRTINVLNIMA
jgi:hypothetical protein